MHLEVHRGRGQVLHADPVIFVDIKRLKPVLAPMRCWLRVDFKVC